MQNENSGKLCDRTIDYGLAVMDYVETLPHNPAGRHISDQLLRSATSVAANYAEASEAESVDDFIHKMKVAMKELKESRVWLLFARRLQASEGVERLRDEARQLILMFGKSLVTATSRSKGYGTSTRALDGRAM